MAPLLFMPIAPKAESCDQYKEQRLSVSLFQRKQFDKTSGLRRYTPPPEHGAPGNVNPLNPDQVKAAT